MSIARAWPTILDVPALIGLGLSHRTAPLAVRERLALAPDEAVALMAGLVATDAVDEAVALSTCNRTELYVAGPDAAAAERAAVAALAAHAGMSVAALALRLSARRGRGVAEHLFAVAAGLDSMVLGEAEILGQLRRAHELSREAGRAGRCSTASCATPSAPAAGRAPAPGSPVRASRSRPRRWSSPARRSARLPTAA